MLERLNFGPSFAQRNVRDTVDGFVIKFLFVERENVAVELGEMDIDPLCPGTYLMKLMQVNDAGIAWKTSEGNLNNPIGIAYFDV